MENLNNIIFIDRYPQIDLHGYDRESARVATLQFIKENEKLKNEIFVIIHGIGMGIVKKAVHETLRKNKTVKEFKTYYYNDGCTVVLIDLNKKRVN